MTSPRLCDVLHGTGSCTVADKLEDTQITWTSEAQSSSFGNEESVGPSCKYVAWKIRRILSLERQMLDSVAKLHDRIEKLVFGPKDMLISADVKDFFVVGEHQCLRRWLHPS